MVIAGLFRKAAVQTVGMIARAGSKIKFLTLCFRYTFAEVGNLEIRGRRRATVY